MKADRYIQVSMLLHELIASYVQREANTDPLITITRVDLSPDLKRAIVFATTIPDGREDDAVIFLKRHGSELRRYLKQKARLKDIPNLEFMVDAGEKHRQHMDDLVRDIQAKSKQ